MPMTHLRITAYWRVVCILLVLLFFMYGNFLREILPQGSITASAYTDSLGLGDQFIIIFYVYIAYCVLVAY